MPSSVLAALPASLLGAMASLGLDADGCRTRAGLTIEALSDPDGRVPFEAHTRLWEAIASVGGDVGIDLGERIAITALGVVGHAMAYAETAGEALACVDRFRRLVLDDALPRVRIEGDEAHFVQPLSPRFSVLRHPAECQATATLTTIRTLTADRTIRARSAQFMHPRPPSIDRHRQVFGTAELTFGASLNTLVLDADVLSRPIARADPALRQYLMLRASALSRELGDDERVADHVRRAVVSGLAGGAPSLRALAKALHSSERTLQRRLQSEGTGLPAIVDEVRRERAVSMLAEPLRRVGEVAYALGYRDATTFARAFRRWTGLAPEAWRRARAARPSR